MSQTLCTLPFGKFGFHFIRERTSEQFLSPSLTQHVNSNDEYVYSFALHTISRRSTFLGALCNRNFSGQFTHFFHQRFEDGVVRTTWEDAVSRLSDEVHCIWQRSLRNSSLRCSFYHRNHNQTALVALHIIAAVLV